MVACQCAEPCAKPVGRGSWINMAAAPACVLCRFYMQLADTAAKGNGICRRHPPLVFITPQGLTASQPFTNPTNWCGEGQEGDPPPAVKVTIDPPKGLIQ
jgi:hypothetical protein